MNLFQSLKDVVGLPRVVSEEQFKKWRREAMDPVIRSGECYVPMPGKEEVRFYRDKQNLHHLGRYEWAKRVLRSSGQPLERVLDCASGVGYGSAKLAEIAGQVESVDRNRQAIMRAESRYARSNIRWHALDAAELRELFEPESFDAVVSFQTIECLDDDRAFLADVVRLLKPGGRLLIDTPARSRRVEEPKNSHQKRNYSTTEWIDLLLDHFPRVEAFDELPEREFLARCDFPSNGSIVVCSKPEQTDAAE